MQPQRISQQRVAVSVEDDWAGVTNPVTRRRVQNRLNQRAYRSRQRKVGKTSKGTAEEDRNHPLSSSPTHDDSHSQPGTITCRLSKAEHLHCTFAPSNIHELMANFERGALNNYLSGSPQTDNLISLSRINVLRAAYQNAIVLGMTAEWMCQDDTVSVLCADGPHVIRTQGNIPPSLLPTALQRETPHHPWLDIFPFPRMRDNLIKAGDHLDDDELCHDLTAFWDTRSSNATLLVWGEPWDPQSWEVTEDFAKKWGTFLQGCPEILRSTNAWRVRRGDRPLVWKRIFGLMCEG